MTQFTLQIVTNVSASPLSFVYNNELFLSFYYRPQRSWFKVMFLQASVIQLIGGCLPQCMLGYPPEQMPPWSRPPTPWSRHPPLLEQTPLSRPPKQTPAPLEQTPPRADTPQSRHPPGADTPPEQTLPQSRHPPGVDTPLQAHSQGGN